jgi:hypothetical protein
VSDRTLSGIPQVRASVIDDDDVIVAKTCVRLLYSPLRVYNDDADWRLERTTANVRNNALRSPLVAKLRHRRQCTGTIPLVSKPPSLCDTACITASRMVHLKSSALVYL